MAQIILNENEKKRIEELGENLFMGVENHADCQLIKKVSNPNYFLTNILKTCETNPDMKRIWYRYLFQELGIPGDRLNSKNFKVVGFLELDQGDFNGWSNYNTSFKYFKEIPTQILDKIRILTEEPSLKIFYTFKGNPYKAKVVSESGEKMVIAQKNITTGFKRLIYIGQVYKDFFSIPINSNIVWKTILNEFGSNHFMQFPEDTNRHLEETRKKDLSDFSCEYYPLKWVLNENLKSISNYSHITLPSGQINNSNGYRRDVIAVVPFIVPPSVNGDSDPTIDPNSPRCSICLEDYVQGSDKAVLTTCGHLFHKECIDRHYHSPNITCPNCRIEFEEDNILTVY